INYVDPSGLYANICRKGNEIWITIPMVYTGAGATPGVIDRFNREIESTWSGQFGPYTVHTDVPELSGPAPNANYVDVSAGTYAPFITPDGPAAAHVDPGGQGHFQENQPGSTAAHEAGHMMGYEGHRKDPMDIMAPGWSRKPGARPSPQDIETILGDPTNSCDCP
ncbi:MAG: hypothetical protein AB1725_12400, partial [Armatimonadota bacterium]